MQSSPNSLVIRSLLFIGMLLALHAGANAQRWEDIYGGPSCPEAGHNGVHKVVEGGYIAVGETFSNAANCQFPDVYVVRTDNYGQIAWSKSYDMGNIDVGTDIEEVQNAAGGTDGFIITGYTNHGHSGDPCAATMDMFLLRIDRCGNVVWARTYGLPTVDEYAWDVIRTTVGNGTTTHAGDYVVAGWSGNQPNRDGMLVRADVAGNLIWGRTYPGIPINRDDYFYALDEITANTATFGQIVAAGGSTSTTNTLDAWLRRVNGNTGLLGASTIYGRTTSNEDLRSVQEVVSGTRVRDIVAAGQTTVIGAGAFPDVYLLETDGAFNYVADRILGAAGAPDEGFYIREITTTSATIPSRVVVTGYMTPPITVTHGIQDAFVQIFTTGALLGPVTAAFVYGSTNFDQGWSVEPVVASGTCITPGFVVAGVSMMPLAAPNDPSQLYLWKTDGNLRTGCERAFSPSTTVPMFPRIIPDTTSILITPSCVPAVIVRDHTWRQEVCTLMPDGTANCPIPSCAPPKQNIAPGISENVIDMNEGAVRSYPNPVERGQAITLECTLGNDAAVSIMVSDMNGVVMENDMRECVAGTNRMQLVTEGWPAGTYVIQVKIGDVAHTRRVIVTDR